MSVLWTVSQRFYVMRRVSESVAIIESVSQRFYIMRIVPQSVTIMESVSQSVTIMDSVSQSSVIPLLCDSSCTLPKNTPSPRTSTEIYYTLFFSTNNLLFCPSTQPHKRETHPLLISSYIVSVTTRRTGRNFSLL